MDSFHPVIILMTVLFKEIYLFNIGNRLFLNFVEAIRSYKLTGINFITLIAAVHYLG